jgi:hypothetical protein
MFLSFVYSNYEDDDDDDDDDDSAIDSHMLVKIRVP